MKKRSICQVNLMLAVCFLVYWVGWSAFQSGSGSKAYGYMLLYCGYAVGTVAFGIGCVRSWPYYTNKPLYAAAVYSFAMPAIYILEIVALLIEHGRFRIFQPTALAVLLLIPSITGILYLLAAGMKD